jgi:hypothetical protein
MTVVTAQGAPGGGGNAGSGGLATTVMETKSCCRRRLGRSSTRVGCASARLVPRQPPTHSLTQARVAMDTAEGVVEVQGGRTGENTGTTTDGEGTGETGALTTRRAKAALDGDTHTHTLTHTHTDLEGQEGAAVAATARLVSHMIVTSCCIRAWMRLLPPREPSTRLLSST